ncbi:MAG: CBS domain-containing protein, partial [Limnochordales bacterium]
MPKGRRGIVIVRGAEVRPTERITVRAAMTGPGASIHREAPVREAYRRLVQEDHEPLIVVDDDGQLVGVVSLSDLRTVPGASSSDLPVEAVARTSVVTVYPDDTLERAMRRFGVYDFAMLPVVARDDPRRVVGRLRRSDV